MFIRILSIEERKPVEINQILKVHVYFLSIMSKMHVYFHNKCTSGLNASRYQMSTFIFTGCYDESKYEMVLMNFLDHSVLDWT